MKIKDKVFLITGGGSGLGAATARMIKENGGDILLVDVDEEKGSKVSEELGGRFLNVDVTNEKEVQLAMDVAISELGGLHGVVNCAGLGMGKRVVGTKGPFPLEDFKHIVEVNLIGTFNVIRLAGEAMSKLEVDGEGERGVFINTSSVAAFEGQIGQAAYSASKAGIVGMTLPIARELSRFGIRVMTIAPGIFDTPLLGRVKEEMRVSLGKQVPFPKRLGKPEEFAMLVKGIIENTMLNGETIRLDGAIRMEPR